MLLPELIPSWNRLREAFRPAPKPARANGCECPSCLTEDRILALFEIDPEQMSVTEDVRCYVQNALGTIGTAEELAFLFPALARLWAEKLEEADPDDSYGEHFWDALSRHEFLAVALPDELRSAATEFLRTVLLSRIGREGPLKRIKGLAGTHLWTEEVSRYAQTADDLKLLWKEWWAMPTAGHAVAAVQVASCFAFKDENNPIFHRWTPGGGGGPPVLKPAHGIHFVPWRESNVKSLRRSLTAPFLESSIMRACRLLEDPAEKSLAEAVLEGVRGDPIGVADRIHAFIDK